ncbi:uncharacterized protein LOC134747167 [Cydia strobilella]|uniref:uncharacterized protein LOC134747167 n=1 Tax=Cydia strobilella TaxID=1100964 RepID=UPI00300404FE
MSILKVLPLMYLMVKASALRLPGFDPQYVKEYNENCVCPTETPTIINSLDSDHLGVERLVVFVYKKPDTGEIISFIPQKEHQRKIPDFPDTYGHIHNIDQNPSIRDIFEISPSKDLREHKTYIEPVPQHDSNKGKENTIVPDDKIPKDLNFNEQYSNTDIKIPTWHMSLDQNKVKPEHIDSYSLQISGENDDIKTDIMINDIDMEIPKWQVQIKNKDIPENDHKITKINIDDIGMKNPESPMQLDGIKVKPEHFILHPNDHKNTEIMIDNSGIKIPKWPMQLDGIKVKPEHFILHPNDHKNTKIMIDNSGMKIPEWPMQLDGIKVKPEHFISHPNDHKNIEMIIDNSGMKIPEFTMQFDGVKVKPGHFISHPNYHKNIEMMIDNSGMKIPQWPMQLDGIQVKPEHFISHPNYHKNIEMMIDNSGMKIPQWPMQLDGIQVKPEHFISHPNGHKNIEMMIDNSGMKIPEFPMQLDGIKVKPGHFISHPNDQKNTGIMIDDIGMKLPEWQMQIDQSTVKPEHFTSYAQHISGEYDHKKPEIVIDTDLKIPKLQMQLDENNVKPEAFISNPNDHKKAEIIIDETDIEVPKLQMELDIISQLVPGGNDQTKTEIVIDNIKPPTQDVSSELIPVSGKEYPNSHDTNHASVKPLIDNDLNLDKPSKDSTLLDSLEPQNLFEESSPEHTPGGIETIWHKEQNSLDEANHSIHIRPPPTERFQFSGDKEIKTPTFQRMKVPRKDKYGRIIGWTYKTIKTYWEGGSRIPNNWEKFRINRYKPFNYHHQYIEDPAFGHWLREQLRITTLNGNRIPTSTADIIALDRAIRNVLLQNGWIVTGEGTLLDGSGKISSLDNLKLRPILVGKPFSYDRFMKQSTHESTTSSKVPYLEGLLLTMIQPAKILGIVPLSISPHKHHSEASVNERSSKAENGLLRVLPIEELVSFRKDSQKSKTKKPQVSSKNKPKGPQGSSKTKFKDAALLRQALSEIQQPQYAKGSLTTLKQRKGQVKYMDYGKDGIHRIITPEMPEWRIIGGNSATSSGTPLEWKGRSGLYG